MNRMGEITFSPTNSSKDHLNAEQLLKTTSECSNLRHSLARTQNKGLSKYQQRASQLQTSPAPADRGREAGGLQPEQEGKRQSWLQKRHPPPNCEQAPSCSQVFLGSWTLDICQEGCSQRSAPQRRHTAHLRQCSCSAPRKRRGWDPEGD